MHNLHVEIKGSVGGSLQVSGAQFRIDFQVLILLLLELISYSEMKIE